MFIYIIYIYFFLFFPLPYFLPSFRKGFSSCLDKFSSSTLISMPLVFIFQSIVHTAAGWVFQSANLIMLFSYDKYSNSSLQFLGFTKKKKASWFIVKFLSTVSLLSTSSFILCSLFSYLLLCPLQGMACHSCTPCASHSS